MRPPVTRAAIVYRRAALVCQSKSGDSHGDFGWIGHPVASISLTVGNSLRALLQRRVSTVKRQEAELLVTCLSGFGLSSGIGYS
jgi:hypothetical protein